MAESFIIWDDARKNSSMLKYSVSLWLEEKLIHLTPFIYALFLQSARDKMLQLQHVIAKCLNEDWVDVIQSGLT